MIFIISQSDSHLEQARALLTGRFENEVGRRWDNTEHGPGWPANGR